MNILGALRQVTAIYIFNCFSVMNPIVFRLEIDAMACFIFLFPANGSYLPLLSEEDVSGKETKIPMEYRYAGNKKRTPT